MAVLQGLARFKITAMDDPEKYWVIIGGGVGAFVVALREGYYRFKGTDPILKKMQEDISAIAKTSGALSAQLEYLTEDHHKITKRVAKIEQNGKKK